MSFESHPLADLLPEMSSDDFSALVASIRENGQRVPIVMYEGKVLDGRHRVRACADLGIDPVCETYDGDNPASHVLALNVSRRHLSPTQRAMLATTFLPALREEAKARQAHGMTAPGRSAPEGAQRSSPTRASDEAAAIVGVASRTVERAARVVEDAPDLAARVNRGEMSIKAADEALRNRKEPTAPKVAAARLDTERGRQQAESHKKRVFHVASTLSGFARGIDAIRIEHAAAAMNEGELAALTRDMARSLTVLRKFNNALKEIA